MVLDDTFAVAISGGLTLTLPDLDVVIFDHPSRKVVVARLHPALRPIVLWRGEDYDAIGDWTQDQANSQLASRLADLSADSLVSPVER